MPTAGIWRFGSVLQGLKARFLVLALAASGGMSCGAAGLTSQTDFTIDAWQTDDGLPQSSVKSIAQTPDGYLWLATFNGLARFDGVRFTVFDTANVPGLPGNRLIRLSVDRDGALWVITEYKGVARLKDGRCRTFSTEDGVPAEGARWVDEDPQGVLWLAGQEGGLRCWRNGKFVPVPAPAGFAQGPLGEMVTGGKGEAWFQHQDRLFHFENGQFALLEGPDREREDVVKRVCPSRDGGLWVVTSAGLRKHRQGKWLPEVWPCPNFKAAIVYSREDFVGNLWVATYNNGLFRFTPAEGWVHLTVESGLTTLSLRCLFCDLEGNVWIGTDGGGLLRIKPRSWKMITRREGLGIDAVHSVCQDRQGRIWFAGGTTRPYLLDRGAVSVAIPPPQSDVLDGVWAVLPTRDGAMWIGTYGGKVFQSQDGVLTRYGKGEGMLAGSVRALLEDRQGTLWVGGFDGLSRIDRERVTHYSRRDGLSSERVWALVEDSKACLYVGTSGAGLNRFQDGRFTAYTHEQGLPDDVIQALYVDAEDVLWIGTHGGGLSRFRAGRFFNYRVKSGLPARSVGPMLEDDEGRLWMATDLGIVRVSRHELNEFAEGRRRPVNYLAFDRSDGLATVEVGGIQPACLKARDGKLWFGTAKGAAFLDPKELRVNSRPPPVVIHEVRIDDEVVEERRSGVRGQESEDRGQRTEDRGQKSEEGQSAIRNPQSAIVTVLPHQSRVEFRFTGLSFTAPAKVRFRYRMEGFDADWVDCGTARSASYARLPAGRYRFRVTACNNDGVWNEAGAALGVMVLAPWYRTWWAYSVGGFLAAGLVVCFCEARLPRLRRARALQADFSRRLIDSQEADHKRMAKELHDGLGQNLILIKNRAELGLQRLNSPVLLAEQLREVSDAAAAALDEVRATARTLHPYELDRLGLTQAIEAMAQRVGETSPTKFLTDLDNVDGLFPPDTQINLYRILQEGVNNVLKHARAAEVILEIKRDADGVRATLLDDGCGFDPAALSANRPSGLGLQGMTERAGFIGGKLRLQSAPGRGTRLEVTIPLPSSAYG